MTRRLSFWDDRLWYLFWAFVVLVVAAGVVSIWLVLT